MGIIKKKLNYVSLDRIKREHAHYNLLIGQRSNGKTFAVFKEALERFVKTGEQSALIRRWREDFRGKRGEAMFRGLVSQGIPGKLTDGKWTEIAYYAGRWYLARYDEEKDKLIKHPEPFCFAFALSEMEHLSTIIRQRNNVVIYMMANTINKYAPYWKEMGLVGIDKFQEGDLKIFRYGESELRVAVQFTDSLSKEGKPSDVYFAFNNPKLQMITGQGQVWEIDIYPHCPRKYYKDNVLYSYFIDFNDELLQCDIVNIKDETFTFIHRKTGKIKYPEEDLIFSLNDSPRLNHRKYLYETFDKLGKRIYYFFQIHKVFYQDNDVGELVRNYLMQKGA